MSGPVGNLQGLKRTVASLTIAEGTQISHFFSFIECPCLYSYENSPVCCPLVVLDTTSNLKAELNDYDSEPARDQVHASHTAVNTLQVVLDRFNNCSVPGGPDLQDRVSGK